MKSPAPPAFRIVFGFAATTALFFYGIGPLRAALDDAERDQIAGIAKTRPSIRLEFRCDRSSSDATLTASPQIAKLGKALANQDLSQKHFAIAYHTSRRGGAATNRAAAARCVDAVRRILITRYNIASDRLSAAVKATNSASTDNSFLEITAIDP